VLPVINNEENEVSLVVVQMEPKRKTETEGSSGRPAMTDEPNESSAKSVLTEVKRSTKRVLHGSIIADEEMDATLKSEVFFNTTDGHPSGLRETSFPVPPASKEWTNWFVYLYPTLVF
jgi:hypothetical protein